MTRYYSIFVAHNELLSSPFIQQLSSAHDISLRLGELEIVNFLLQYQIPVEFERNLCIHYEPDLLHIEKVTIERYKHQTLVSMSLTALEMGSTKIGFSLPQHAKTKKQSTIRRTRRYVPPFTMQSS